MMARLAFAAVLVTLLGAGSALAQGTTDTPQLIGYRVYVNGELSLDGAVNPFGIVQTEEADIVLIEVDIRVVVDTTEAGDEKLPELYYEKISRWWPYDGFLAPEGPTVQDDTAEGVFVPLVPRQIAATDFRVSIGPFSMPEINGANQARLRGLIDYDVQYVVSVGIWNAETAGEEDPVPRFGFYCWLLDNPALRPQHPSVFPDAGSDTIAEVGQTVYLDARRSFTAYNVGFDPLDPDVFDKDIVTYAWEWLSGPAHVEPVLPDPSRKPWLAQVAPTQIGVYQFRVFASTQEQPLPLSDTVQVTIVEELPDNHPPIPSIVLPEGSIVEGQVVTLDGSSSRDPDGDALQFRWRQTDEVGQSIDPSLLATTFQPLGGLTAPQSQWQAVHSGTYYFILLLSDGQFTSSKTTQLTVLPAAAAGETAVRADTTDDSSAAPLAALPGNACGAGLTPLLLAPLALLLLRGRVR